MGLADDLGYSHRTSNPLFRLNRAFAGTTVGAWLFSKSLRHLDNLVARLSGGRQTAAGLLAGLAVLDVTTTGRKSGQRRTSHLIATPYGDGLGLLGTNFGQPSTPAWALNLEADPHATVSYRHQERAVVARRATPQEADEIFRIAGTFYGGYLKYRSRVAESRDIRVFVLEAA